MTECKVAENKGMCPCTVTSCGNHGVCCDCLSSHLGKGQLPACAFPPEVAKTTRRSVDDFISLYKQRGGDWL